MRTEPTVDAAYPTVTAPRSGKRVRYLETADDTDGEYARFEMWLAEPPQSHGPMKHVHPEQDEYLEVRDGTLGVWHDGTTHRLSEGEGSPSQQGIHTDSGTRATASYGWWVKYGPRWRRRRSCTSRTA